MVRRVAGDEVGKWAEISGNLTFIGITVGIHRRVFSRGLTRSDSCFIKIPLTVRSLYQIIL